MLPLEREILNTVKEQKLLQTGDKVVVGVSGGPDSMALLYVLHALARVIGCKLMVVYVNHGLRVGDTEAESKLVEESCNTLGIEFKNVSVDVLGHGKKHKKSIEHAARDLRYDSFRRVSRENGGSLIAVAHTADDQVEEIILKLLRGAGMAGLSGMRLKKKDINRPLLQQTKKQLTDYLNQKKIKYCIDPSNAENVYVRNRVRNLLLPYLEKEFDSGVRHALRKSAEILEEDEDLLLKLTNDACDNCVTFFNDEFHPRAILLKSEFLELHGAIQRRLVELLLWRLKNTATFYHIKQVVGAAAHGTAGAEFHLKKGLRVGVQKNCLEFSYPMGLTAWRGRLFTK